MGLINWIFDIYQHTKIDEARKEAIHHSRAKFGSLYHEFFVSWTPNDADLAELSSGAATPQSLFQKGKLRVDGDVEPAHREAYVEALEMLKEAATAAGVSRRSPPLSAPDCPG